MKTRSLQAGILGYCMAVCILITPCAQCQNTGGLSQASNAEKVIDIYDVNSVKVSNATNDLQRSISPSETTFQATCVPLTALLAYAYELRESQITGLPKWANSAHFDVIAKASDPDVEMLKKLTWSERRALLLPVLVERFHLRAHIETRTLPVYNLIGTKHGPKFTDGKSSADATNTSVPDASLKPGNLFVTSSYLNGRAIPLSTLATGLAQALDRNVIDRTGYTGLYDFTLKWSPVSHNTADNGTNVNNPKTPPEIFTAIQEQLGLKLVPAKGPVKVLIVDHVEFPSGN